jgi:acyl-CoA reductase-like NAD-dependent aldehyde dehydrogenase
MLELVNVLECHKSELVASESRDAGKPTRNATSEVEFAIDLLRFAAGAGRVLEGKAAGEYVSGFTSVLRREPLGVVAGITPWNYPIVMLAYKLAPALATGNAIIVKPAELTPLTTLLVAELSEGILPPGVFNVVLGDGPVTGDALATHPDIGLISVTGSSETGIRVAERAAPTLKRVVLELGGKSPVVVFADADLPAAARSIVAAALYNSGQDCTAASRLLVDRDVFDDFSSLLASEMGRLTVGGPASNADLGPLISSRQVDRVSKFVERAVAHGAELHGSSAQLPAGGHFLAPLFVTGVSQDAEIVQREVFGPVFSVQAFSDEADAVRLANGTRYALGASVWTSNASRATRVSARIKAGAVWVNCHDVVTPEMPHGGLKASGYGKDLSMYSLEEYTHIKHVMTRNDA